MTNQATLPHEAAARQQPAPQDPPPVPVEVRARYDGQWCAGFEVVEIVTSADGMRFRLRRAGGEVLPVLFEPQEIRTPDVAAAARLTGVSVTSER